MDPSRHADPLEEALSHGSQRVAQLASLAAAMAQVAIHRKALHDARTAARDDEHATRVLREQERLLAQHARASWAPAHDQRWLAHADLAQAGRAWAGAAYDADAGPAAAAAMRKCEDRLHALHAYGMARYDRLRADGISPLDAMRQAAPLFVHSPDPRVGDPAATRPALTSAGEDDSYPLAEHAPGDLAAPGPGASEEEQAQSRGERIAERLQARARAAGRSPLGPDELAMVLEAVTNLPEPTIASIARQIAGAERSSTPSITSSPARLAADSFPHSAAEAVRAATRTSLAARPQPVIHKPGVARRSGSPT